MVYKDQQAIIVQVFPVEVGKAEYGVYVNKQTLRVKEDDLVAVEVDVYELVNR